MHTEWSLWFRQGSLAEERNSGRPFLADVKKNHKGSLQSRPLSSKGICNLGLEREDLGLPKAGLTVDLTTTCSIT